MSFVVRGSLRNAPSPKQCSESHSESNRSPSPAVESRSAGAACLNHPTIFPEMRWKEAAKFVTAPSEAESDNNFYIHKQLKKVKKIFFMSFVTARHGDEMAAMSTVTGLKRQVSSTTERASRRTISPLPRPTSSLVMLAQVQFRSPSLSLGRPGRWGAAGLPWTIPNLKATMG